MDIDVQTETKTEVFINGLKMNDVLETINNISAYAIQMGNDCKGKSRDLYHDKRYTECYFLMKDRLEMLVRGFELIKEQLK